MKNSQIRSYLESIRAMDDEELGNEIFTLRNERRFLNCWSDDEVAERLMLSETEMERRANRRERRPA